MFAKRMLTAAREFWDLPRVEINLMLGATAGNDPFFERLVKELYRDAHRRSKRHLFLREMVHGVAICKLPPTFDAYYMLIDASARRNHKKAIREGCEVRPITYNDHLSEIADIWTSTDVRQGKPMPEDYLKGAVKAHANPASNSPCHDYPYFGVFYKGKMIGYAGCLIAGDYCGIMHVLGHADHLPLGAVPMLFVGIAKHLYEHHKQVKFYNYGMYFGAADTLRRFKRKFDFLPHRVTWTLGETPKHSAISTNSRPTESS